MTCTHPAMRILVISVLVLRSSCFLTPPCTTTEVVRTDIAADRRTLLPPERVQGVDSTRTESTFSSLAFGVVLGVLVAVVGANPGTASASGWSHTDIPAWSKEYPACSASSQSPIDINTSVVDASSATDSLNNHLRYMPVKSTQIVHNGHVMQVNGNFGAFGLPDGEYLVKQFHFHFPAEHEINGKLGAGELHIVHQKKGAEGTNGLAVLGIILDECESGTAAPELNFLSNLGFGQQLPPEGESQPITATVDLNAFAKEIGGGFYHYNGSLTTPPCAENVHWYVTKKAAPVTKQMIKSFKERFPDPGDNRPVQPVNGRTIVLNDVDLEGEFAA